MPLQIDPLDIEPDPNGVFDGRLIAQNLISIAFQVLVPYTGGCPACTDTLFGFIANSVLSDIHERGRAQSGLPGRIYPFDTTEEAVERHLAESEEVTRQSLQLAGMDEHKH